MQRSNNEMRNQTVGILQAGVSERDLARRFNDHPCTYTIIRDNVVRRNQ